MLFESIQYRDNLPFEISFLNIGEESKHCHKSVEILLVLRGVTHYQIYHTDYELNPGDLIIADTEDLHQIHDSSDDVMMLSMHIDTSRFDEIYPNIQYMFFVCEECMDGPASNPQILDSKLAMLKGQIAHLTFRYFSENTSASILMEEINKVVSILVDHFQGFYMEDYQYKATQQDMNEEDLRQLCRITRYILLNYRDKITLNDIAEMEHLSSYYLSHLIKENLGFNFQSFLNAIRLEFAEKELVFTGKTLLQISQDCGFSSPNYFNKCFSAWYGKTPAQYRKEYVSCERSYNSQFTQEKAFELLSVYLSDTGKSRNEKTDFLTPVTDFTSGGFSTLKGPAVLLDSISSIITLNQNREKISAIHPSAIMIDSDLLERNSDLGADMLPDDLTVRTGPVTSDDLITSVHPAEIFSNIFTGRQSCISLHSSVRSPFTSGCIDSAAYKSYSFLFAYGVPQVKAFDTYALIKCDGQCAAVFYNTGHVDMYIHIPKASLPPSDIIMQRIFSNDDMPDIIRQMHDSGREIPSTLMKGIRQCYDGKVTFPYMDRDLDFALGHMEAAILEFITL